MQSLSAKQILHTCCPRPLRPYWDRIESSDVGYRLAKGTFWSAVGIGISRGLILAAMIVVARTLGKTAYGELGMFRTTVGMFGVLAGCSLGVTSTKYVAEFRRSDPVRAGRIIGLSAVLAIVTGGLMSLALCVFAADLAEHAIKAPHLTRVLRIGAIMLFTEALNGVQTGALAGLEAFKTIARVNILIGLGSFPILIGGAYLGGLSGAVWGLTIHFGISLLLNHLALRSWAKLHGVPVTFRKCWHERAILWSFCIPAVLCSILFSPVNWVCSAMLVNRPGGYDEMGIYNAANQWYAMALYLPSLLGGVVLPVLSERLGQKEIRQSERLLISTVKMNALLVLPLVLSGCIASPFIMSLYGEDFASEWSTLVVVLLTGGLLAVQIPVGQVIAASGRMWINFMMSLGWGIVFISVTLLLLDFGSLGLAVARALTYVVHSTWTLGVAFWIIRKSGK